LNMRIRDSQAAQGLRDASGYAQRVRVGIWENRRRRRGVVRQRTDLGAGPGNPVAWRSGFDGQVDGSAGVVDCGDGAGRAAWSCERGRGKRRACFGESGTRAAVSFGTGGGGARGGFIGVGFRPRLRGASVLATQWTGRRSQQHLHITIHPLPPRLLPLPPLLIAVLMNNNVQPYPRA
jgi:hypothetical protein